MINRWRSDCLASIAAQPFYARVQTIAISSITESMRTVLCAEFPVLVCLDESWTRLQENIVGPAAKLATNMRLAPVWYFQPPMSDIPINRDGIQKTDLADDVFKDVSTRKMLGECNLSALNDNDQINEWMMQVEPRLIRKGGDGTVEILVRKGVIALKLKASTKGNKI